jgi:hypothetical protein
MEHCAASGATKDGEETMNPRNTDPTSRTTTTETGGSYASGSSNRVIDLNAEEAYWRQAHTSRPYYVEGTSFTEYKPAYRYGADAHTRYPGRSFDDIDSDLGNDWDRYKGTSSLAWDRAKHAARDAWERTKDFFERVTPGDSDRDGK